MPAPSELTYFIGRIYARSLDALPGPYLDAINAAGAHLEAAVEAFTPLQLAHKAKKEGEKQARRGYALATLVEAKAAAKRAAIRARAMAKAAEDEAKWEAVAGMSLVERRAFEHLPRVCRPNEFNVAVTAKPLGKRNEDGFRPCEFQARYSSAPGIVGGGPGCTSGFRAATEALQFLATDPETRTLIREATDLKSLCDVLKPLNWVVMSREVHKWLTVYAVRRISLPRPAEAAV